MFETGVVELMRFKHGVRTGGILGIYFHFFYNMKVLVCSYSIVVVFVVLGLAAFETVFHSLSGRLPERERKRREMIVEIKNVQTTPRPHLLQAQQALALPSSIL